MATPKTPKGKAATIAKPAPKRAAAKPMTPSVPPKKPSGKVSQRYVIIMAGGRGERFWPVSREKTPKQLIRLLGERSFLQQAVDRVLPVVPASNVLIITNAAQVSEVRRQLPELPKDNIVAEPIGRDTCDQWIVVVVRPGAEAVTG